MVFFLVGAPLAVRGEVWLFLQNLIFWGCQKIGVDAISDIILRQKSGEATMRDRMRRGGGRQKRQAICLGVSLAEMVLVNSVGLTNLGGSNDQDSSTAIHRSQVEA